MFSDLSVVPLRALAALVSEKVMTRKDPDRPYVGLEDMTSGSADLASFSPSNSSVSTNSVFEKGDVLFGKLRPNLRKSVIAPFSGYCSTDILVLRPRTGADPRYVGHLFRSEGIVARAVRTAIGTRMPRTSWADLQDVHVFAPDIGEQRHVAAILDTVDESIQRSERLIAKLQQVNKGLLHDLLTRGVDENGGLRDPEWQPRQFCESIVGLIPRDWDVVPLRELVGGIDAGWSPACVERPPATGEWGVLKLSAVTSGRYLAAEAKTLPSIFSPRAEIEVSPGDVILARANGVADLVGVTVEVPATPPRLMLSDKLLRLRPNGSMIRGGFLALLMQSASVRRQVGQALSGSSGQKNISQVAILGLRVAVPRLDEQDRVIQISRGIDDRVRCGRSLMEKLHLVKRGLENDLLIGRVRVTKLLEGDV